MATLLADPPATATGEPPAQAPPPSQPAAAPESAARDCPRCHAPMLESQDWCLQCGAGAPGSLATRSPVWGGTAGILAAVVLLVAGAAAAAYAAWGKSAARNAPATIARSATPPAATGAAGTPTPGTSTSGAASPSAGASAPAAGATTTGKALGGLGGIKPPKIPLAAVVPKAATSPPAGLGGASTPVTKTPSAGAPSTTGAKAPSSTAGSSAGSSETQEPILLDTNAASTYNPYSYPTSDFGDPSLAIDGEPSTAWTASVNPEVAPLMAEGLVIDLRSGQRLSALTLTTTTPGMTVQVYAADGASPPASITDKTWIPLSHARDEKKTHVRIALSHSSKAFRFVLLWISRAPASSIGTAQAPGRVSVNEVELFPAAK